MSPEMKKKEIPMHFEYTILRPGGNDTALVVGIERDLKRRKQINDAIMAKHVNVEQVGFVSGSEEEPELMMAGGEFCGNATRSAAWLLLDGKPGELTMIVSGVDIKLHAGVRDNREAFAQMPIYQKPEKIQRLPDGNMFVEMKGIVHVVSEDPSFSSDPDKFKKQAFEYLKSKG